VRPEKLFRLDEANLFVPRLESLVARLQRGALHLQEEMIRLAVETGVAVAELSAEELVRRRPTARALIEELDGIVREIESSGAHLKDVKLGLVDFPTERDGEIIYLCWQSGEPEVAFWHRTEDGFAGRQPLPGTTRTPYLQ
jgi:hypothetical protein